MWVNFLIFSIFTDLSYQPLILDNIPRINKNLNNIIGTYNNNLSFILNYNLIYSNTTLVNILLFITYNLIIKRK